MSTIHDAKTTKHHPPRPLVHYRGPIRAVADPNHGTLYAELTISHSPHSTQFSASLAPTTVYANGWGTTS